MRIPRDRIQNRPQKNDQNDYPAITGRLRTPRPRLRMNGPNEPELGLLHWRTHPSVPTRILPFLNEFAIEIEIKSPGDECDKSSSHVFRGKCIQLITQKCTWPAKRGPYSRYRPKTMTTTNTWPCAMRQVEKVTRIDTMSRWESICAAERGKEKARDAQELENIKSRTLFQLNET